MHMMLLQLCKKSSHHSSLPSTANSQDTAQEIRIKRRKDLFPKRAKPRITSAISQRQTRDEMRLLWLWRRRKKEEGTLARNGLEQSGWLFIDGFGGQVGSLERGAHESVGRAPSIPTPEAQIAWLWWWRG
jgi:hypothetical protein